MRRLEVLYRRLGRPEKALLALLAIFGALRLSGASAGSMAAAIVAVYIAGIWVLVRWARLGIRKAVWRLRNRLIVAYLFIALVPVSLILVLVNIGLNILTGQMAAYLVISEIERSGGLALRGGELYFGARPAAPVTGDEVAGLAPHLGEVSLLPRFSRPRAPRLPPRYNLLDRSVLWPAPVRVAGASEPWILVIHTRPSALLRAVFAGGVNWGEGILVTFTVVAAGFLVVELVCFFIGFSLSRTVTGAVHEL
ncbi:MAG: hypothetical protein FJW37_05355, partial [Acidobacteria bacterium]|nr:hypothetical protein [Acidobacteriota bacterium]